MKNSIQSHYFMTSDRVKLHYYEAGKGPTIVMLPGGGLAAEEFRYQLESLDHHYHVIAIDMCGHGKSEKVNYGYRISRFAQDLYELIKHKHLDKVNILAHSLGCSVLYNYWDLHGGTHLSKLILIDEPAVLMANPNWPDHKKEQLGAIYNEKILYHIVNSMSGPNKADFIREIIDAMTTSQASQTLKNWLAHCMSDIPGTHAASLYFNNITQDWRDVIQRINIPTLLIAGEKSVHPPQSQQWLQSQIPHAQLKIFPENQGGNHFMHVEAAEQFNQCVQQFINI
ncbi:alpha/beta fold hydrolase [Piscirickettsia litoralis]|uniref:AB hydrolase-1 domain-containing protein n=1 Tax=Piscirickettsia litoralis TaxID=1891921 RepID=A0ABX3A367_9GAMM|nr:alpha/beta hydrolase [Piscirickettsia litoralis]ODN41890.1 hypothetical protein BGC07_01555 [Piscirickettsia litoralis]